jgi:general L-amino acid transport system substrate-binding protein
MTKKLVLLGAALALVAVACGGGEVVPSATTAPGPAETTPAPAGDGGADTGGQVGGGILAAVQSRGQLICGVNNTVPGFGFQEPDGSFSGFDVDYCRAIAAAALGSADSVQFRPTEAADRATVLQTGEVDVLIRNTTWTQTRDVSWGDFGPTTFYDGQGLMGLQSNGFTATSGVADLEGAILCTIEGTTSELNINTLLEVSGVNATVQTFADADGYMNALQSGSCDVATTDKSQLASRKATASPQEFSADLIIPELTFSKEPLGPVYPANDSQWGAVVDWVVYATLIAEEKGITSANIDAYLSDNPDDSEAQRLFGNADYATIGDMGLARDAFYQVIKQVGNYAEIYIRNLGPDTPFNLPRGLNSLWTQGGLLYPPPAR